VKHHLDYDHHPDDSSPYCEVKLRELGGQR